jgi:hypothetical protein
MEINRKTKFIIINGTLKYIEVEGALCPGNIRVKFATNRRLKYIEVEGLHAYVLGRLNL